METFRFRNFPVYQEAKQLFREIVKLSKSFPREYWELADQMRRCALSICLNIAEGSAKRSDKDFNRFIENSLGSANELMACLDISYDALLLSNQFFVDYEIRIGEITKQLGGLSRKLRSS